MLETTDELDYTEALEWFGLHFLEPGSQDPQRAWNLERLLDANAAQQRHPAQLVAPSR